MGNKSKLLTKLEQDLSFFMIQELCKKDPTKRGSSEMYRFKGLAINSNEKEKDKDKEKTIKVRIGALEAEFKINSGDKVSGALAPEDERLVMIWMNKTENMSQIKQIFTVNDQNRKPISIVPVDLEEIYK